VGASGIGKSTLLHIMGTLDRPMRGRSGIRAKMYSGLMMMNWPDFGMNRLALSFSFIIFCPNLPRLKMP